MMMLLVHLYKNQDNHLCWDSLVGQGIVLNNIKASATPCYDLAQDHALSFDGCYEGKFEAQQKVILETVSSDKASKLAS